MDLRQAETNTLAGSSNAIDMGNDVRVTGNASLNLIGTNFTSAKMGGLSLNTGRTLTIQSLDTSASEGGIAISGNGAGFGQTLRFGSNLVSSGTTTLGHTAGGAGTVTIASDANVAFDGKVTDEGRAMTLAKTGTGRIYFTNTNWANANSLLSTTTLDIQAGNLVLVGSTASGAVNPIDQAGIRLSGGGLVLDSAGARRHLAKRWPELPIAVFSLHGLAAAPASNEAPQSLTLTYDRRSTYGLE
jgi:hypothetical protein